MKQKILKLNGLKGFMYGIIAGAVTGLLNTYFFSIPHLGACVFIAVWVSFDPKPRSKDK